MRSRTSRASKRIDGGKPLDFPRILAAPVVAAALILALQGCAVSISPYRDFYPAGSAGEASTPAGFPRLKVLLRPEFEYRATRTCVSSHGGCPSEMDVFDYGRMLETFRKVGAPMEIGYGSRRTAERACADLGECDLEFRFTMVHRENPFLEFPAKLLTILSLALLPMPFPVTYEFKLAIRDRDGRQIGSYRRVERMTEWVHAGFLFLPRRNDRWSGSRRILDDVIGNILLQVRAEGILAGVPSR